MVRLVDTHSHIFVKDFEDKDLLMKEAETVGVEKILMPNIDVDSINLVHELRDLYPSIAYPMMGLHPCSVASNFKEVLAKMRALFKANKYVAVGEIGLDFYWSTEFKKEQIEALELQLQWAVEDDLPVSLHTRDATQETINICKNFSGLRGVFHCFGGTANEAKEIINLGMHIGLGGVLTFKNANLGESIKDIPLDKLVLETDAPYLAPHPNRGKQNSPAYLPLIAAKLAELKELSLEEVAKVTTRNAEQIFEIT